jgi:hypothetical protein
MKATADLMRNAPIKLDYSILVFGDTHYGSADRRNHLLVCLSVLTRMDIHAYTVHTMYLITFSCCVLALLEV